MKKGDHVFTFFFINVQTDVRYVALLIGLKNHCELIALK